MKEAAFVKKNDHAVGGKCWILQCKEKAKRIKKSYTSSKAHYYHYPSEKILS